jgi:hypothetical protein
VVQTIMDIDELEGTIMNREIFHISKHQVILEPIPPGALLRSTESTNGNIDADDIRAGVGQIFRIHPRPAAEVKDSAPCDWFTPQMSYSLKLGTQQEVEYFAEAMGAIDLDLRSTDRIKVGDLRHLLFIGGRLTLV